MTRSTRIMGLLAVAGSLVAACGASSQDDVGVPAFDGGTHTGLDDASSRGDGGSSGGPGQEDATVDEPDAAPPSRYIVSQESVQAAGRTHEFVLVRPRVPTAASLPIVFVYHGDGGTGPSMQQSWRVEEAAGDGAIVVYPSRAGGWEVTNQSWQNPNLAGFDAMLAKVVAEHGGDAGRVTALGWSNGGFFTQILACWRGAALRAVGAMAGSYPYDASSTGSSWPNSFPRCEGQRAVPALIMHGANDGVGNGELSAVYWTYVNRCAANPQGCNADTSQRAPGLREPCVSFTAAPADKPVHLCTLPNFGHAIWDQSAAAMWEFTQALP